jgi:HK97 family phage major capsid protein
MPSALVTKREELAAKRAEMGKIFAEAGSDLDLTKVKGVSFEAADSHGRAAEVKSRNDEINALAEEVEGLVEVENIAKKGWSDSSGRKAPPLPGEGDHGDEGEGFKTIGELFVESKAFTEYDKTQKKSPTVEVDMVKAFGEFVAAHGVKAAIDYGFQMKASAGGEWATKAAGDPLSLTGYTPQAIRLPTIITPGEMENRVADLIPQGNTNQNSIPYMEETTTTNGAVEVAEGATKPPSEILFTEKTSPVRKIATILPVTDELFADAPGMRSYVENRLRTFVKQREDGQLLVGDGSAPNLRGILNISGIQTQAKGSDPTPDAIFKAMTKIEVNAFLDASGVVMHPNDWQDIALLRTADGIYIWGSPNAAVTKRIWGLPVVTTTRITENTALVGAFRDASQIFRRSELAFAVSDQHSDFFAKNLLALRVEERLALVVFRPKGFCTVTGV